MTVQTKKFNKSVGINKMDRRKMHRLCSSICGFVSPFLGAFVKFRTATISFVMSVRPSVCLSAWNNSAPTGRILMKFDI